MRRRGGDFKIGTYLSNVQLFRERQREEKNCTASHDYSRQRYTQLQQRTTNSASWIVLCFG